MVMVIAVELVTMKVEVTVDLVLVIMDDDTTPVLEEPVAGVLEELSGTVTGVLLLIGMVTVVLYVSVDDWAEEDERPDTLLGVTVLQGRLVVSEQPAKTVTVE